MQSSLKHEAQIKLQNPIDAVLMKKLCDKLGKDDRWNNCKEFLEGAAPLDLGIAQLLNEAYIVTSPNAKSEREAVAKALLQCCDNETQKEFAMLMVAGEMSFRKKETFRGSSIAKEIFRIICKMDKEVENVEAMAVLRNETNKFIVEAGNKYNLTDVANQLTVDPLIILKSFGVIPKGYNDNLMEACNAHTKINKTLNSPDKKSFLDAGYVSADANKQAALVEIKAGLEALAEMLNMNQKTSSKAKPAKAIDQLEKYKLEINGKSWKETIVPLVSNLYATCISSKSKHLKSYIESEIPDLLNKDLVLAKLKTIREVKDDEAEKIKADITRCAKVVESFNSKHI